MPTDEDYLTERIIQEIKAEMQAMIDRRDDRINLLITEINGLENKNIVATLFGIPIENYVRFLTKIEEGSSDGAQAVFDELTKLRSIKAKVCQAQWHVERGGANEDLTAATVLLSQVRSDLS